MFFTCLPFQEHLGFHNLSPFQTIYLHTFTSLFCSFSFSSHPPGVRVSACARLHSHHGDSRKREIRHHVTLTFPFKVSFLSQHMSAISGTVNKHHCHPLRERGRVPSPPDFPCAAGAKSNMDVLLVNRSLLATKWNRKQHYVGLIIVCR